MSNTLFALAFLNVLALLGLLISDWKANQEFEARWKEWRQSQDVSDQ